MTAEEIVRADWTLPGHGAHCPTPTNGFVRPNSQTSHRGPRCPSRHTGSALGPPRHWPGKGHRKGPSSPSQPQPAPATHEDEPFLAESFHKAESLEA